jgi:hypothetical protein
MNIGDAAKDLSVLGFSLLQFVVDFHSGEMGYRRIGDGNGLIDSGRVQYFERNIPTLKDRNKLYLSKEDIIKLNGFTLQSHLGFNALICSDGRVYEECNMNFIYVLAARIFS